MKKSLSTFGVAVLVATGLMVRLGPASAAPEDVCVGTHTGATFQQLIVRTNTSCTLRDSTVAGAGKVEPGASLYLCDTSIGSGLKVDHAYLNTDANTTIAGALNIVAQAPAAPGVSPCALSGSSTYTGFICPKTIGGSVTIHDSPSGDEFAFGECGHIHIGGPMSVVRNLIEVGIDDTAIDGSLVCRNNSPDATIDGVTAQGGIFGDCDVEA